jgi:hypothetical protein
MERLDRSVRRRQWIVSIFSLKSQMKDSHNIDKDFVLCSPRIKSSIIQEGDLSLISRHLAHIYRQNEDLQNEAFFKELIPKRAEKWMKVRIARGGDMAHASDKPFPEHGHRDASFIRVSFDLSGNNNLNLPSGSTI